MPLPAQALASQPYPICNNHCRAPFIIMIYPELFLSLEKARWSMATDVPWDTFEGSKLSEEQAQTIRMNAITEWSALPATEMFLRDNQHDSDFSAFMSIWFYEEQKHSLVLIEYLKRFRPDLVPTEAELHNVRFEFDRAPALETLMLHFCGEIRLTNWYRCASEWHSEPVIKHIYGLLSKDEARHAGAYLKYMKQSIERLGVEAKLAFAKIGVLMASSARSGKPLHPTNLHVNKTLFPNDTIQSRLPDVAWLERWLDEQIRFDKVWENRVLTTLFTQAGKLFDRTIASATDLAKARKEFAALLGGKDAATGAAGAA
jgi:hypothetical protein